MSDGIQTGFKDGAKGVPWLLPPIIPKGGADNWYLIKAGIATPTRSAGRSVLREANAISGT
jgi:hypothetical protein